MAAHKTRKLPDLLEKLWIPHALWKHFTLNLPFCTLCVHFDAFLRYLKRKTSMIQCGMILAFFLLQEERKNGNQESQSTRIRKPTRSI